MAPGREPDLADQRFFDLVEMPNYRGGSLEVLSGQRARRGGYETTLVEEGETAWFTPLKDLRCSIVRTLLGQRMGLEWLARPIAGFVDRYPDADCGSYPGEMLAGMLAAADEFDLHARPEFRSWLARDLNWIDELFGWSRRFRGEVLANLERARALGS